MKSYHSRCRLAAAAFLSIFVFGFFLNIKNIVNASEDSGIPFTIESVQPDNQISTSKGASYLDLLVEPGTVQNLSFDVSNSSQSEQHFILDLSDATTSDGLAIDYGKTTKQLIGSPKISDMIKSEDSTKKITVPAKSTQRVTFQIKYPDKPFEGIILGGVTIYQDIENNVNTSNEQNSGIGVSNLYRYALGIQLQSSLDSSQVKPDLELVNVAQDIDNYHPVLKINLKNPKPAYISQVSTTTKVMNGQGKIIDEYQTSLGQIAPISDFNLILPLQNGSLKPGNYSINTVVRSNKTGQEWQFNKNFTITDDNYKATDNQDANRRNFSIPWMWILIFILLLIIFILLFLLFKKRKEKNDDD